MSWDTGTADRTLSVGGARKRFRIRSIQPDTFFVVLVFLVSCLFIWPDPEPRRLAPADMVVDDYPVPAPVPPEINPGIMAFGEPYGFGLATPVLDDPFTTAESVTPPIPRTEFRRNGTAADPDIKGSAVSGVSPVIAVTADISVKPWPLSGTYPAGVHWDKGVFGEELEVPELDGLLLDLGWRSGSLEMLLFVGDGGIVKNVCFMPNSFPPDSLSRLERALLRGIRMSPAPYARPDKCGRVSLSWRFPAGERNNG